MRQSARASLTSIGLVLANDGRPGEGLADGVSYRQAVMERMTDQKGTASVPFYFGATPRLSII